MQRKKTDFDVLRFGRDEGERLPVGGKRKSQDTLGTIRRRRGQAAPFERVQGKERKRVRLLARISIGEGQLLAIRAPCQPEISIVSKVEELSLGSAGRGNGKNPGSTRQLTDERDAAAVRRPGRPFFTPTRARGQANWRAAGHWHGVDARPPGALSFAGPAERDDLPVSRKRRAADAAGERGQIADAHFRRSQSIESSSIAGTDDDRESDDRNQQAGGGKPSTAGPRDEPPDMTGRRQSSCDDRQPIEIPANIVCELLDRGVPVVRVFRERLHDDGVKIASQCASTLRASFVMHVRALHRAVGWRVRTSEYDAGHLRFVLADRPRELVRLA